MPQDRVANRALANRLWIGAMALGLVSWTGRLEASAASVTEPVLDDAGEVRYDTLLQQWKLMDAHAPVDYGPGRGLGRPHARTAARASTALARPAATAAAISPVPVPVGGSDAGYNGTFGAPVTWPVIAIHMALLPDGRVMSYGTDENGLRGAYLLYDVWDPTLGTDTTSHLVLPNSTGTDIFCSGQSLMWTTGDVMVVGGDRRIEKQPTLSEKATTVFDPPSNTISTSAPMNFPRWYGSLVALPSGDLLALGGRAGSKGAVNVPAPTPEIFDAATGWQALTNATSMDAFFTSSNWFYPRAFVAPNGLVFVLGINGGMYWLDPVGDTITLIGKTTGSKSSLPALMYAPGKILSLRNTATAATAYTYDLNGAAPIATRTGNPSQLRQWANATVMADGRVLVNGGASGQNVLVGIAYQNEIWDPATGVFTLGAIASKPRLYHSNALLLPDATVVTAAGGTPGPVENLNAEIFYPPYLYLNDGSGQPAPRPSLLADAAVVHVGQPMTAEVGPTDQISRLTLVKMGAATHSVNLDQRFIELSFVQTGSQLATTLPSNGNVLMPGYYMMFAFNAAGTPSIASTIMVQP